MRSGRHDGGREIPVTKSGLFLRGAYRTVLESQGPRVALCKIYKKQISTQDEDRDIIA